MRLASILSIVAAMMLTGCATGGAAARQRRGELNIDKMNQVERVAFAHGVKVIWVNPPTHGN